MKSYFKLPRQVLIPFILLLAGRQASGQLCTGSLGDPSVNITFGKGPTAAKPLNAATTSYTYSTADCPNDGFYAIRNNTVNCFNSWHSLSTDHTGDGNGYFMLVNASFTPSDFYLDTVRGLCSNTVYEFSAWLMNLGQRTAEIRPSVIFTIEKIDGTVLHSFASGNVPVTGSPTWNKYGFFFQIPAGTFDVVLRMRNNSPGGSGNDLALDDITFRACGPRISSEISGLGGTIDLCEGDNSTFTLTSQVADAFASPVYQWQVRLSPGGWKDIVGATTQSYVRMTTGPGRFEYRLTTAESVNGAILSCRVASLPVHINVHAKPMINAGVDRVLVQGEKLMLDGKIAEDSVAFSWSPPVAIDNVNSLTPTVNPLRDAVYTLTGKSARGCVNTDSVRVKVVNAIYIPNAFTPNGDGHNDEWRIPDLDPSVGASVKIFNRAGGLVYEASGSTVRWNGTLRGRPQPSGTFIYTIDLKNGKPLRKGLLVLIR